MAQSSKKKVSANRSRDKGSILARTDRAEVVGTNGPKSEIWKGNVVLSDLGQKLVAAGTALKTAQGAVNALETQLDELRGLRDTRVDQFDAAYELYVTSAEASSKTPEDAAGLGLLVRVKGAYPLATPLGLEVMFDANKSLIRVHVHRAPGNHPCIVEISKNPEDPSAWKRLPGVGAIQSLVGYAPGTYWLRAACVRANEQSRFTDPVSVVVR